MTECNIDESQTHNMFSSKACKPYTYKNQTQAGKQNKILFRDICRFYKAVNKSKEVDVQNSISKFLRGWPEL